MHFFETSSFLGTTCYIKWPHLLSYENIFSCDNKMWKKFRVWSHIFVYSSFYFCQLVVDHPVDHFKKFCPNFDSFLCIWLKSSVAIHSSIIVKGNGVSYLFIYILEKETLFQKTFLLPFVRQKQQKTTSQTGWNNWSNIRFMWNSFSHSVNFGCSP